MVIVVVYDIVSNRRRARLSRRLDSRMRRVQKSVFEGTLPEAEIHHVRADIIRTIDPEVDTVRIYHLCPRCNERTELIGTSPKVPTEPEDVIIDD